MNIESIKKKILVLIGVCLLLAVALFYFNSGVNTTERSGISADKKVSFEANVTSTTRDLSQALKSDGSVTDVNVEITSEEIVWKATPEQIAELRKWKASRGWYDTSQSNQDDYKSYSRDVLKQLADGGDLNALHMLNKGTPVPEKKALLTKAAMYGSTYAIAILRSVEISTHNLTDQSSDEERKEAVIGGAVYPVLANMRGDLDVIPEREFSKLEKEYSVQLNGVDRQVIEEKAAKLYAELESQREQLGLGKFDNSIPPIAQAYYKARGLLK